MNEDSDSDSSYCTCQESSDEDTFYDCNFFDSVTELDRIQVIFENDLTSSKHFPDYETALEDYNENYLFSKSSESSLSDESLKDAPVNQSLAWNIDVTDSIKSKIPKKIKAKGPPKQSSKKSVESSILESLDNDISLSSAEIRAFKVLDLKRWYCMSRPQYSKSCGISSLVSVWNFLYSTIGTGLLPPLTQEKALYILGFKPPFNEIRFGPFTGNATLMKWFAQINNYFQVKGRASYMFKPKGRFKTKWVTDESALDSLKHGLEGDKAAFIYHCLNHYFCPVGYEDTPQNPVNAYRGSSRESIICQCSETECQCPKSHETWVFIGEPSKKHPPLHCKKWTDILKDLHMESPNYYDIRRQEKGVITKNTKKTGTNLHCIIGFYKQ